MSETPRPKYKNIKYLQKLKIKNHVPEWQV